MMRRNVPVAAYAQKSVRTARSPWKTEDRSWIKNFVSSAENVRISVHRESGEIVGQEYPVKTLVKELMKDLMFYEQSGGGVTLSGGEVMAMSTDYVLAIR